MGEIHKSAAMFFKDNTFLMVRKKGKTFWTSLGGRIEKGETQEEALLREIKEEVNCDAKIISKMGDFKDKAIFDDAMLKLSLFHVELIGTPEIIDNELEEFTFIDKNFKEKGIKLTDVIINEVIPYCIKNNYLKW
ncbi:MAG: NUDIX domain-containing protein [archaeon]